jgi:hypothetical protein
MPPRSRYPTPPTIRRYRAPAPQRSSTAAITLRLVVLATVATLIIGGLLAVQMASGSDPALGPKATARAKKTKDSPAATNGYGDDGYVYGSSGYGGYDYGSSGSGGYSGSTTQSAPPPVTSSTS